MAAAVPTALNKITQELEQYIRMSDRMPSEDTTMITVLYYPASIDNQSCANSCSTKDTRGKRGRIMQ